MMPSGRHKTSMASVKLTNVQFRGLLAQVSSADDRAREVNSPLTVSVQVLQGGGFASCNHQFYAQNETNVDTFVDAILTYKDCAFVSDEYALRGLLTE